VPRRGGRPHRAGGRAQPPGQGQPVRLDQARHGHLRGDRTEQGHARPGGLMDWARLLHNRDFLLFWSGVVLSQVGTRATVAASLWQVYDLTGSIATTGLVGGAQAVALVVLSPLGGVLADRWDRRGLLQASQAVAMIVALAMAAVSLTGVVQAWHVIGGVLVTTAAATFDQPCRQALVPAPRRAGPPRPPPAPRPRPRRPRGGPARPPGAPPGRAAAPPPPARGAAARAAPPRAPRPAAAGAPGPLRPPPADPARWWGGR